MQMADDRAFRFRGPAVSTEWFYQVMGDVIGPLSPAELREHAENSLITPDSFVRKGAHGEWVTADRVKGLFGRSPSPPRETRVTSRTDNSVAPTKVETGESDWSFLTRDKPTTLEQVVQEKNLRPCQDCGHMVSKRAASCPNCGCPLSDGVPPPTTTSVVPIPKRCDEVERVRCSRCGSLALKTTVDENKGLCKFCSKKAASTAGAGGCLTLIVFAFLFYLIDQWTCQSTPTTPYRPSPDNYDRSNAVEDEAFRRLDELEREEEILDEMYKESFRREMMPDVDPETRREILPLD